MVVDAAGHLMGALRCTDALWVTAEIAQAKANTAVAFRASTAELEERWQARPLFAQSVMNLGPGKFVVGKVQCPLSSKVLWWVRWGLVAYPGGSGSRHRRSRYGPSTQPR